MSLKHCSSGVGRMEYIGVYWGYIRDNGKDNGNYYISIGGYA